jgi:hypothetical protein
MSVLDDLVMHDRVYFQRETEVEALCEYMYKYY